METFKETIIEFNKAIELVMAKYPIASEFTSTQQRNIVNSIMSAFYSNIEIRNITNFADNLKHVYDTFVSLFIIYDDAAELNEYDEYHYDTLINLTEDEISQIRDNLQTILDNWENLVLKATRKLNRIGYSVSNKSNKSIHDLIDEVQQNWSGEDTTTGAEISGEEGRGLEKYDDVFFEINPLDTASARIKLFLNTLKDPNKRSFIQTSVFYEYNQVYADLLSLLADTNPSFHEKLEIIKASNLPYRDQLVNKLESAPLEVQSEFVKVMTMQSLNHKLVLLDTDNNLTKIANSNRTTARDMVILQWRETFKTTGAVTKDINGNLYYDKAKINTLWDKIDPEDFKIDALIEWLSALGIDLDVSEASRIFDKKFNSAKITRKSAFRPNGIFGIINNIVQESKNVEDTNIFTDSTVKWLASVFLEDKPVQFADNFLSVENKRIWGYAYNNRLSDKIRGFKDKNKVAEKLQLPFSKRSEWIKELKDNPDYLTLHYLDGLKKQNSSFDGKTYEDMSPRERELVEFSLMFNNGSGRGIFINPPHADKAVRTLLEHNKVSANFVSRGPNGELIFSEVIGKEIQDIVESELDYIITHKDDKNIAKRLFYFFPTLNYHNLVNILTPEELNIIYAGQENGFGILNNDFHPDFRKILYREAEKYLKVIIESTAAKWKAENFIKNIDKAYVKSKTSNLKLHEHAAAALELNYFFHNVNYYQTFAEHPSNSVKMKTGDNAETVFNATIVEAIKRGTKDVAPGSELEVKKLVRNKWVKSDNRTIVIVKDKKAAPISNYINSNPVLKKVYSSTNVTDGSTIVSLQEFLAVSLAENKIKASQYKELLEKDENMTLSNEDLAVIFQVKKPVVVSDYNTGTEIVPFYIKNSEMPLLKQYTIGTPLEDVRQKLNKNKIDALVFDSAVKIGKEISSITTFEGFLEMKPAQIKLAKTEISRDGFKIQQEIPFKEKDQILTVSQMDRLLFANILELDNFNYKGKKLTGAELKAIKEDIRIKLYELSKARLYNELGVEINDGVPSIVNINKFSKRLIKLAKAQNLTDKQLEELEIVDGKFRNPLFFNNAGEKLENVLLALFSNNIVKQKVPGFSSVQVSDIGKTLITDKDIEGTIYIDGYNKSELSFIDKSGDKVTPAEVLLPWKFKDNNGELLKMENYLKKDDTGRTVVDLDKLPKEILRLIGARIPNQGHNSMLPMVVVGFIPSYMGNTIVVPKGITTQMGSGFYDDKLYSYMYNYHVGKNGKIIKGGLPSQEYFIKLQEETEKAIKNNVENVEELSEGLQAFLELSESLDEQPLPFLNRILTDVNNLPELFYTYYQNFTNKANLQNEYIDINWEVLTHPEVIDSIIKPLDLPELKNEKELFDELGLNNVVFNSLASHAFNDSIYEANSVSGFFNRILSVGQVLADIIQNGIISFTSQQSRDIRQLCSKGLGIICYVKPNGSNVDYVNLVRDVKNLLRNELLRGEHYDFRYSSTLFQIVLSLMMIRNSNNRGLMSVDIMLLLKQECLTRLISEESNSTELFQKKHKAFDIKHAISHLITEYSNNFEDSVENIDSIVPEFPTKMELWNFLYAKKHNKKNDHYWREQINILKVIEILCEQGRILLDLHEIHRGLFNSSPRTIVEFNSNLKRIEEYSMIDTYDTFYLKIDEERLILSNISLEWQYLINYQKEIQVILDRLYSGLRLTDIYQIIESIGWKKSLSNKDKNRINSHYRKFFMSSTVQSEKVRKSLVQDSGFNECLANKVIEAKRTWGINNLFLKKLYVFCPVYDTNTHFLYYLNSKVDLTDTRSISLDFCEIYRNDQQLFIELVHYAIAIGGINNLWNYIQFVPIEFCIAIGIYDKLNDLVVSDEDIEKFVIQYFQTNPNMLNTINGYLGSDRTIQIPQGSEEKYRYCNGNGVSGTRGNLFKGSFLPMVKVYANKSVFPMILTCERSYQIVDKLGGLYIDEFCSESRVSVSIIKGNKGSLIKTIDKTWLSLEDLIRLMDNKD